MHMVLIWPPQIHHPSLEFLPRTQSLKLSYLPNTMLTPEFLRNLTRKCRCDGDTSKLLVKLVLKRSTLEDDLEISDLDVDKLSKRSRFLKLIEPHIGEITLVDATGLENFGDLSVIFPRFPDNMNSLRSLVISLRSANPPTWAPIYDDPFTRLNKINTLTKFSFVDPTFSTPLKTLFAFLEGNPLLEHVELSIGCYYRVRIRPYRAQEPISLSRLQFLSLTCSGSKGIEHLISRIPPPEGAQVEIFSTERKLWSRGILVSIRRVATPPVCLGVDYNKNRITWSGGDGELQFNGLSHLMMSNVLEGKSPLFYKDVDELRLRMPDLSDPAPGFDLSLFPALHTLIIEQDRRIVVTLCKIFSSKQPPNLQLLRFYNCTHSECTAARQLLLLLKTHAPTPQPDQQMIVEMYAPKGVKGEHDCWLEAFWEPLRKFI